MPAGWMSPVGGNALKRPPREGQIVTLDLKEMRDRKAAAITANAVARIFV